MRSRRASLVTLVIGLFVAVVLMDLVGTLVYARGALDTAGMVARLLFAGVGLPVIVRLLRRR